MPTLVPAQASEYEQAIRVIGECMSHAARDEPALECRLQSGVSIKPNNPIEVSTQTPAARVLGVHYEGPFVNREQCGALHREHFRVFDTVEKLDSLPTIKVERAIHMMTVAPEIEGGIALIKELAQRNWVVSIGHTRATADILDQAMAAGARHLTHFMNAMTPLHH
ncbi:MAG TPA: hypothetical protein VE863_19110, partial [Pyrinomonadaceae bacterium]|nr:hypothetical protein [Pyrinomonadaceae bacterium]